MCKQLTSRTVIAAVVLAILFLSAVSPIYAQTDTVRIMPLGNSITRGVAGSIDQAGYRRQLYLDLTASGYTVDLVGSQSDGIPVDFDSDHEGHGGWHANQIRDNIYGWLQANPADIVLLHIGTNDISGGDEDTTEVAAILDEIDRYESDSSATVVVLVARIILRADGLNPQTIVYNDGVEALVQARIASGDDLVLVDMENALTYPDDLNDAVHPNDSGYAHMTATWLAALDSVMPQPPATLDSLTLAATSPDNYPTDDLICTYALTGTSITAATVWYLNDQPLMTCLVSMEGGATNALADLASVSKSATPIGDPTYLSDGGHDGHGAFEFDGDDGLDVGSVFPTNSSYTVTAWVYRQTGANNYNILSGVTGTPGGHAFWAPAAQSNALCAGHNGSWYMVIDSEPLSMDVWHFVAVTYDRSTALLTLYKDSVWVDTATVPAEAQEVSDAQAQIGAFNGGNNWAGRIDEVHIYDRCLSEAQLLAMYQSGGDIIKSAETSIDDDWQARVVPFSATARGLTYNSNTLTIQSDEVIEIDSLELVASSPDVLVMDDLICNYTLVGDAVAAATSWFRNSQPLMLMYLPFEGGEDNFASDYSGSDNHGIVGNGATWDSTCGHDGNGVLMLDGTATARIDVGQIMPSGAYTKTAWVRPTASASNNIISGSQDHAFWAPDLILSAGHSPGWTRHVEDSDTLELDTWYFVAVTYDPNVADGQMILYKDGEQVDVANAVPSQGTTDQQVYIGSFGTGANWNGYIDDARLYNVALTPEEIVAMYTEGENTIKYTMTAVDDVWQAAVTPFSHRGAGETQLSNTLLIETDVTLEALSLVSDPLNNVTTDNLVCSYTLTGSSLTAATTWLVDDAPLMSLYLPFEGNSCASNTMRDFSGNDRVVSSVGDPTWYSAFGPDGFGAYYMDGASWLVADGAFPTSSSYTKTAWVYRTGSGANGGNNIVSGSIGSGGHAFWAPDTYSNHLSAGNNSQWQLVSDTIPLSLNEWHYVAVTYDFATGYMALYRDGGMVDDTIVPVEHRTVTDSTLRIGAYGTSHTWLGYLDDVRVYPRALSTDQIQSLYSAGRDVIVAAETQTGETWQAMVTPLSEKERGRTAATDSLYIQEAIIAPSATVDEPASGQLLNYLPELSLTFSDDLGLRRAYYQLDSCTGSWTEFWSHDAGGIDTTILWTLPAVSEAVHDVYLLVEDDAGNLNADSCVASWSFTYDMTPPEAPTDFTAQFAHQKVTLDWINSASADLLGAVVRRNPWNVGAYPEYSDAFPTPLGFPASPTEGDSAYAGLDTMVIDSGAPRSVYFYSVFAVDSAGNYSPATEAHQAMGLNYWLGDVSNDGYVDFDDLMLFSNAFGTADGDPAYNPEFDIGPTHDSSVTGIPLTDDLIDFEDLILFAINFNTVAPAAKVFPTPTANAGGKPSGLSLGQVEWSDSEPDVLRVPVILHNPGDDTKGLCWRLAFDPESISFVKGRLSSSIADSETPVFFSARAKAGVVEASLAVLGGETSLQGSGRIAILEFRRRQPEAPVDLMLTHADVRDARNRVLSTLVVGATENPTELPRSFALHQNYPNPFNPDTRIVFELPRSCQVSLDVFNVAGQKVATLVDERLPAGIHQVRWRGTDHDGRRVASGVYLYRLRTDHFTATRKAILVK